MSAKDYEGYYWRRRVAITVLNLQPLTECGWMYTMLAAYCLDRPDPMPMHPLPREAALIDVLSAFRTLKGN